MAKCGWVVVILFFAMSFSTTEAQGPALIQSPSDLSVLTDSLKRSQFHPVATQDLAKSRSNLLAALSNVPGDFCPKEWQSVESYLRTKDVASALTTNAANAEAWLVNLLEKVSADAAPNEKPNLLRLRVVLKRHLQLLEDSRKGSELETKFISSMRTLQSSLQLFGQSGSTAEFEQIAAEIRFLEKHSLASNFVQTAKRVLSHPNLEICLPSHFMRMASMQQMNMSDVVDRNSEGVVTRGNGEFRASAYLEPAVDGPLVMRLQGDAKFSAVSTRKKIQFRSFAQTDISGTARIKFDHFGLMSSTEPKIVSIAKVCNCNATADVFFGKRLIGRLADRAISRKTPELEDSLASEVNERVQTELKSKLSELTSKANVVIKDTFWPRARRLDLAPRELSIQASSDELRLVATLDAESGLAAPFPYRHAKDRQGLLAVHQTLATNLLNNVYVGQSRPQSLNSNTFQQMNDSLPFPIFRESELRDDPGLTLTLDFPRPFSVIFHEEVLTLVVHANQLLLLDEAYPPHDVRIAYRTVFQSDGGIRFVLQGRPLISPVAGEDSKPKAELVEAVQNDLLGDLLQTFTLSGDALYNRDNSIPVRISRIVCANGWLSLNLDLSKYMTTLATGNSNEPSSFTAKK